MGTSVTSSQHDKPNQALSELLTKSITAHLLAPSEERQNIFQTVLHPAAQKITPEKFSSRDKMSWSIKRESKSEQ
jgi:hypothetical protein